MPRVHGTAADTEAVVRWQLLAFQTIRKVYHSKGVLELSKNAVHRLIGEGRLPAPPENSAGGDRGKAITTLFSKLKCYENTGREEPSIQDSDKHRQISIWRYNVLLDTVPRFEDDDSIGEAPHG